MGVRRGLMEMTEIWVAGEALVDLVPSSSGDVVPIVGGGPANTAKALAQLGNAVMFIDGISDDAYGMMIEKELREAGVDLSKANFSAKPTAIAQVKVDSQGSASYEFQLEGTATFDFSGTWLPQGNPDILHIGTLATLLEPGASVLYEWAKRLGVLIVFDPNIRPSVMGDKEKYRAAVERWIEISDVVKLSDDDLHWLYPEVQGIEGATEVAKRFVSGRPSLIVVTRGVEGMVGVTESEVITVSSVRVDVVDTVGAGDTVGAIVVEGLMKYGLDELVKSRLREVLERASKAAAITCSRAGARPPTALELL